jgi:protease I
VAHPRLVSTDSGTVQGFQHLDKADTFDVDDTVDGKSAADYDGWCFPGGVANPDYLRMQPAAVAFAKSFLRRRQAGGGHLSRPVDDGRGRRGARSPDDLVAEPENRSRNAGADWVGRGGRRSSEYGPNVLVTSRKPDDLKAFCGEVRRPVRRRVSRVQQADPSFAHPPQP